MNQKIQTVALLLIAICVVFLMANHFGTTKPGKVAPSKPDGTATPKIVYINEDTLLANYQYMNKRQEEFAQKEAKADAALKSRGQALEREFASAQDKIQKGLLAPNQVAMEEQRLMKKQQALVAEQERLTREFMAEGQKLQEELNTAVKDLLTALQKEFGYDYILKYGSNSGVLMVNKELDITRVVLERLNQTKVN
jgi:outer membrane protein